MNPECPACGEPIPGPETGFATINRRLNVVARVVSAQEWVLDGADPHEITGLLGDLERDLLGVLRDERIAA